MNKVLNRQAVEHASTWAILYKKSFTIYNNTIVNLKLFAWLLLFLTVKTFSLNSFRTTSLYKLEPDASFKWCKRCEKIAFIICQLSRILWQVELYYQGKSSKLINTHLLMLEYSCQNCNARTYNFLITILSARKSEQMKNF